MSEVGTYPLVYHFGDSLKGLSWQWKESVSGAAKDITGYLASMKVKTADGTLVLHLDSAANGGLSIPVGTDGAILCSATPTMMLAGGLAEGITYAYDIQVKSGDGSIIQTLTKGPFRVDKQVTDV